MTDKNSGDYMQKYLDETFKDIHQSLVDLKEMNRQTNQNIKELTESMHTMDKALTTIYADLGNKESLVEATLSTHIKEEQSRISSLYKKLAIWVSVVGIGTDIVIRLVMNAH